MDPEPATRDFLPPSSKPNFLKRNAGWFVITLLLIAAVVVLLVCFVVTEGKRAALVNDPPNTWNQITTTVTPPARFAASAVQAGPDHFYLFGGITLGNVLLNDLWMFDESEKQWKEIATSGDKPSPRFHHACTMIDDDHMIVYGGIDLFPRGQGLNDTYLLTISTRKWARLAEGPSGRGAGEMLRIGDHIYMFGGWKTIMPASNPINEMWAFNTKTKEWLIKSPCPASMGGGRIGFAMVQEGGVADISIWGGRCQDRSLCPAHQVLRYHTDKDSWTALEGTGEHPSPRVASHADVVHSKFLYAFGGVNDSAAVKEVFGDFYRFDGSATPPKWERLSPAGIRPPQRFGHAIVEMGHRVFVFGGRCGPLKPGGGYPDPCNDMWVYKH